nr:hypothetical protein [Actinomycetota bacterium]NIS35596.1 hypothetical protein [Actinomycetota bacterium]NIU70251.1 hypothetical protein [Actinomycetota bacterium]NIW32136.1 hypothetical protein [Actinomycetota bacterium]
SQPGSTKKEGDRQFVGTVADPDVVSLDFSDPRDLEIPTFIRRQMD